MNKVKLGVIALHPIQYQDKLWEILYDLSKKNGINMEVIFLDRIGLEPIEVKDFSATIDFRDVIRLKYPHKFLKNLSPFKQNVLWGRINPGIVKEVLKYDVLLLHGLNHVSYQLAFLVSKLFRKKVMVRGEGTPGKRRDRLVDSIRKFYFKHVDLVFFSCSGNRLYLREFEIPDEKMHFLPCAVDNEQFRSCYKELAPQKRKLRESMGLKESDIVLLFVGRFVDIKRPMDLLSALDLLRNHKVFPRLKTLFVGGGPLKGKMLKYAEEKGLKDKIVIEDFKSQSEIVEYYAVSDIFVLLSSVDPSPKVLNEAMNFELPVICTRVIGTSELIKEGHNGFKIDVGDVRTLAERIATLTSNEDLRRTFGRNSWSIVKNWNFETDARAILNGVRELCLTR